MLFFLNYTIMLYYILNIICNTLEMFRDLLMVHNTITV